MKYYFVCLRFTCSVENENTDHLLCEDSIRLVLAQDAIEAEKTALEIGLKGEHSYKNENGEDVVWRFDNLVDIQEFSEQALESGAEVYSRLYQEDW